MSMLYLLLIVLSTLVTIVGALTRLRFLYLLFKPLTMVLIIALAAQRHAASDSLWLYAAVVLSLIGDVCLMFPARAFGAGLVAFLLAHLAYIVVFLHGNAPLWWWPLVVLLPLTVLYWRALARFKPRLMMAIQIYSVALLAMVLTGLSLARTHHGATLAAGVLLFALSDGLLAWNKFARPFAHAQAWILSSYFAAQTLIVLSL